MQFGPPSEFHVSSIHAEKPCGDAWNGVTEAALKRSFNHESYACRAQPSVLAQQVATLRQKLAHRLLAQMPVVASAQNVQVGQCQSTPWRAKNRKPRNAIQWMDQSPHKSEKVANLLTLVQGFHVYRAVGDTGFAQRCGQHGAMLLIANQDADTKILAVGTCLFECRQGGGE